MFNTYSSRRTRIKDLQVVVGHMLHQLLQKAAAFLDSFHRAFVRRSNATHVNYLGGDLSANQLNGAAITWCQSPKIPFNRCTIRTMICLMAGLIISWQSIAAVPGLLIKSPAANSTVPLYFGSPPAESLDYKGRKNAYLAFTFTIPVVIPIGNIGNSASVRLRNYDTDAHIAYGSLDKAIISGNTVYVPVNYGTSIDELMPEGQAFYVVVSGSTFADASNPTDFFPGSSSENFWRLTRRANDGNGPTPVAFSPSVGQQDAPIERVISIQFDEPVFYDYGSTANVSIGAAPSGIPGYRADLTIQMSADHRTITFRGSLGQYLAKGTDYFVKLNEGRLYDADGNFYAITNDSQWTFKTYEAFNPVSFSPAKNTANLPLDQVFTITMNNDLDVSGWQEGTGIRARRAYDDYLQEYIYVSSDQVQVNGNVLSVSFTDLEPLTTYYISTGTNVIRDAYGQFYDPDETWRFSTGAASNSAPTNITLSASNINENNAVGTVIGTLSTTDPDAGNTFNYTLVSGTGSTDNASFNINGSQLRASQIFDFETKNSYSIRVRTIDQGGLFFEKQFQISITNVVENSAPTNIALSASSINENNAVNAAIGSLSSTDPDVGNTFTYALVAGTGSTDNASFNTNGAQLRASASFNFETKSVYSIRVRTTDQGGLFFEKQFAININNQNEPPADIALSASSINENNSVNAIIGTISAVDPDAGNTFTHTLVSGTGSTDNASFNISGSQLRASSSLNFETKNSYNIRLRSTDNSGLSYEKQFTISVNNLNETATNITLSTPSIDENSPANTVVGLLTTTDPDAGNSFTYSLVSGTGSVDNASFNIIGSQLRSSATFDFETKSSYSIRLRTADQGGLFFEKQFTITINNVTEDATAPAIVLLSPLSGAEGISVAYGSMAVITFDEPVKKAGTGFIRLMRRQTNGDVEVLNYYYNNANWSVSGNQVSIGMWANLGEYGGEYYFLIDEGVIANLDDVPFGGFDDMTAVWEFRLIDSRVPQPNGGSKLPSSVINLPIQTVLSMEFAQNIKFGTGKIEIRLADDFEVALQSFVVGVDPQVQIEGNKLIISPATLPYGTQISIYIEPGAITNIDDIEFEGFTQNVNWFYATVAPPNRSPTNLGLSASAINENNSVNALIGTMSTTDPDAGNTFTYSLVAGAGSSDNASFSINGTQLRASTAFDFETKSSYSIRIRTTDQGGLFFEKQFAIEVNNANENPIDISLSSSNIDENNALNAVIGALSSLDPDAGNTFAYTMAPGGIDNSSFNISGNQLRASSIFNFESKSSYSISVRAVDQDGLFLDKEFTVTISDLNDVPTQIALSASSINENNVINAVVGTLSSTDPDAGNTFTYSLVSGTGSTNNASFNINGSQLRASTAFDFETKNNYAIRVRTTDQDGLFFEKQFAISIGDVAEDLSAPTIQSFDPVDGTIDIPSDGNLTVTFNEDIQPNSGFVRIRKISNTSLVLDGSASANPQLILVSGATLTVNLAYANINNIEPGTEYYVQIGNNAVSDLAGNGFSAGFTGMTTWNFTTAKSDQTISFPLFPAMTYGDAPFEIDAASSSNLDLSFSSSNTAVASLNFDMLTIEGAGSVVITATQGGNARFNAAPAVQRTLTVNKANQTISFASLPTKEFGDAGFALAASASSGQQVTYSSSNTAVASVNNGTVTIVGAGTTVITASQTGTANYNAASSAERTLTVNKANQTLTFSALPDKVFGDPNFDLTATSSSNLTVSYISSNTAVATISGSTVTIVGAGTTNITASQAGNGNYNAATQVERTLSVGKASQTVSVNSIPNKMVTDGSFSVTATTTSGLPLDYSIISGPAIISGNTITLTGSSGVVEVEVSQAGNNNYLEAEASTSFDVLDPDKTDQTITFVSIADQTYGGAVTLDATASSGLVVAYEVVDGPATLNGSALTLTGLGSVTVRATQAGDDDYNPAAQVSRSFEVGKAMLTVTAENKQMTYGGTLPDLTYVVAGFVNSESADVIVGSIEATTEASASSDSGEYTITVSGGTADNYVLIYVQGILAIGKADQFITFEALEAKTFGDVSFELTATVDTNLELTYGTSDEVVATIAGSTVTIVGAGTVTITATQAGSANYNAAEASQELTVNKATQTITFEPIESQVLSAGNIALTATASSGLAVSYEVSGPATLAGTTLTFTGAGDITVTASQAGNVNYMAATALPRTFTVTDDTPVDPVMQDQVITFDALADKTFGDAAFDLIAIASSGLPVSYTITSSATISENTVTITGAGSVTITASQAGNDSFNAAADVSQSFTVNKATATITLSDLEQEADGTAKTPTATTDPAGLEVVFTFNEEAIVPVVAGSYTVVATINDANYQGSAEAVFELTEAVETGVDDRQSSIDVKAYPNPAADYLIVELSEDIKPGRKTLRLFDFSGKEQRQAVFTGIKYSLNLQQQVSGIYLLVITDEGGRLLKRVKVKKE
ncbi:MAG: Ig-like domain-containing protein [Imperialibacter sp.]|uniref:Ig-like domain-containing protein n=1 Tax=Imperialibacter sp. TaxID=2038411 RepID=UPI0032ED065C